MSTQAFARKNDPQTSWDAAKSVKNLEGTRDAILHLLETYGPMIDDVLISRYQNAKWAKPASPSGIRSRRNELVQDNKVEAYGLRENARNRQCTLWRAIPEKGQMNLL